MSLLTCECGHQFEPMDEVPGATVPCPECARPVAVPPRPPVALSTMKYVDLTPTANKAPAKEELLELARQRGKTMSKRQPVVTPPMLIAIGCGLLAGAVLLIILDESLAIMLLMVLTGLPLLGKGIFDLVNQKIEEDRRRQLEAARQARLAMQGALPVEPSKDE